jgi:hypothetical protein
MLEQTEKIKQRYDELTELVVNPEIIADNKAWQKLVKEHSDLTPIAEGYEKLKKCINDLKLAKAYTSSSNSKYLSYSLASSMFSVLSFFNSASISRKSLITSGNNSCIIYLHISRMLFSLSPIVLSGASLLCTVSYKN